MMRYSPDHRGTAKILNSPAMGAMILKAAEGGADYARSISPHKTGEYRRSFRVVPTTVKIKGQPRRAARIENTSPHAQAVEWGPHAHKVLGRTLEELRRRHDKKAGR